MPNLIIPQDYPEFLKELKQKVLSSRFRAVRAVNKELITIYHHIGSEILIRQKQGGWGAKIVDKLSLDLSKAFPDMKGFSIRNLKYMRRFAEEYTDSKFVQEALAQLTWYHNITLLDKVSDRKIRDFYIDNAIKYGWSRCSGKRS
jgi:predicted nuclease of restriction endonuclease-like (RecB) superfamily